MSRGFLRSKGIPLEGSSEKEAAIPSVSLWPYLIWLHAQKTRISLTLLLLLLNKVTLKVLEFEVVLSSPTSLVCSTRAVYVFALLVINMEHLVISQVKNG